MKHEIIESIIIDDLPSSLKAYKKTFSTLGIILDSLFTTYHGSFAIN